VIYTTRAGPGVLVFLHPSVGALLPAGTARSHEVVDSNHDVMPYLDPFEESACQKKKYGLERPQIRVFSVATITTSLTRRGEARAAGIMIVADLIHLQWRVRGGREVGTPHHVCLLCYARDVVNKNICRCLSASLI
jgi:hypothetical protein